MTSVQEMSDLISYVGTRIHNICQDVILDNIDEFIIDEWDGFASFDVHFENEDDPNVIEVTAYTIKTGDDGHPTTDYDNCMYQSRFDIKLTKGAHTMSEQYIQPQQVDSSSEYGVGRINDQTNQQFTAQQIEDIAFLISRHMRNDELFANRMQRIFSNQIMETIPHQVETSMEFAVSRFKNELTREGIVAELMDSERTSHANFVRGMLDNARFRTMVDNMVSSHVHTIFQDNNSWLMELMDQAIERKTRLMVNETVERSLKMIASRISAASDV